MPANYSSTLATASDETIAAAVAEASIPTLMLSMIHMSGDEGILAGPIKPLGIYINEFQGYMSEEDKAQIRAQAIDVIRAYRDKGAIDPFTPSPEIVHAMMGFMVAQEVPAD